MAYCSKCGAQMAEQVSFCPQCGQPRGGSPAAPAAASGTQSGLTENVAGLLCYALGWVTGLIFFLIDKRPSVRFHAAQAIVVFGALHLLSIVLGMIFGVSLFFGGWTTFSVGWLLPTLMHLLTLVLWILLMVKAYQGERFKLPIAGDFAESLAGK